MTEHELREFGRDCFAALGTRMPDGSSPAWRIWAEACADVRLEAAMWIRGKILDFDAMPRNFGKAVRTLYAEWRATNGVARERRRPCPECDKETPGFFTVWRQDGNRVIIRCVCNRDSEYDPMPAMSRAMAGNRVYDERDELRYVVAPAGMSPVAFEAQALGKDGNGSSGGSAFGGMAGKLARHPVGQEPARRAHAEQLEYYADAVPF